MGQETVFDDILERKEVFSGDKNRNKKSIEKLRFFQRVLIKTMFHGFDKKFEIFPSFYFWQNQKGKCV